MALKPKKPKKGAPSWMVSFADLQQLLLVFFILLFSTSTTDSFKLQEVLSSFTGSKNVIEGYLGDTMVELDEKEKGKDEVTTDGLKELTPKSNSEKKLDLLQKELNKQQLAQNIKDAQILESEIKNKLYSGNKEDSKKLDNKIEITATTEGVVMRFKDGVIFEPGGVELKDEAKKILDTLKDTLDEKQNIRIEGHTDDIPTSGSLYKTNWELSTTRAISVMNYLVENKYITPQRCSVEGFSEYRPLVENNSDENRAKNRRVDIILLNN